MSKSARSAAQIEIGEIEQHTEGCPFGCPPCARARAQRGEPELEPSSLQAPEADVEALDDASAPTSTVAGTAEGPGVRLPVELASGARARRVRARARAAPARGPKDARTRDAMREARAIAATDARPDELGQSVGRIAARYGLELDEALELGAYATEWRKKIEASQ